MTSGNEVRKSFLDYFAKLDHTIVRSASLVPEKDPTLLFTNAGMVQFKNVFLGVEKPPYVRAANSQKCLRISGKHNDLEAVGRDTHHHTFFEMLGNWSFGNYYKAEAIEWAWELLTKEWGLPKNKLWATVYLDDTEAERLWAKISGLPPERILRFGEKENFWEMGETGPCGPCSEIHLDRGPEVCDRKSETGHECRVIADCVMPSNEGRGYVLRRLLRRAARHGRLIGLEEPFLYQVAATVAAVMGDAYPELRKEEQRIREIIRGEEERFGETLEKGLVLLEEQTSNLKREKKKILPGEIAFRLYDTYGFPLDLT